jgi:hypothetical protein
MAARTTVFFTDLVAALNAKRSSSDQYSSLCPAHADRDPSLSFTVRNGLLLFKCFAGCSYGAIVQALTDRRLWPVHLDDAEGPAGHDIVTGPPLALYKFDAELISPEKGVVERYLRERGIQVAPLQDVAQHPQALHPPSGRWWPAMVACVRDVNGHARSLHRTYLSYTHPPVKAPVTPSKLLWPGLSVRKCAIHLSPAAPTMLVAEGIETTASAMVILGLPGWSAMSASNLRVVELPDIVREVVIAADNDAPGIAAAIAAAQRFRREGRVVKVVKPKGVGDFNDLLL